MRTGDKHIFDEIFVFWLVRGDARSAPVLRFVGRYGNTFYVSRMRHGYDYVLPFDEVFGVYFVEVDANFRAAFVAVFVAYLNEFVFKHAAQHIGRGQQFFVISYPFLQLSVFAFEFFAVKALERF